MTFVSRGPGKARYDTQARPADRQESVFSGFVMKTRKYAARAQRTPCRGEFDNNFFRILHLLTRISGESRKLGTLAVRQDVIHACSDLGLTVGLPSICALRPASAAPRAAAASEEQAGAGMRYSEIALRQAAAWAIGSAGERLVHTEEVTGSIPVSPTSSGHMTTLQDHDCDRSGLPAVDPIAW